MTSGSFLLSSPLFITRGDLGLQGMLEGAKKGGGEMMLCWETAFLYICIENT
jgi:hypothetical protein